MGQAVIQKIKKQFDSPIEVAIKYYTILSILNDLKLTEREIQILAFTATRGSISSGGKKEEFIEMFNSSKPTIGNLIYALGGKGKGLLKRVNKKMRVIPEISLDFSGDLILQLHFENGKETV